MLGILTAAGSACSSEDPPTTTQGSDLQTSAAAMVGEGPGGVVVLLRRGGETAVATAGAANAAGDPISADSVFRIGSLTKPFVATLVLQLVDEGLVDLEAPLSTYLPDTPIGGDVTIRDLLRHRSGVPNYTETAGFLDTVTADRNRVITAAEVLDMVAGAPSHPPDQEFAYSDTNFILLGQLVEQVAGSDIGSVLRERVTGPLGLEVTQFPTAGGPAIEGLAGGWTPDVVLDGDPAAPYDSIASAAGSAGALVSTARELQVFLDGLFGGELLREESITEMTTTDPDDYGLGIGLLRLSSGTAVFGHDGDIPGYLSFMAIEPESGDCLIVLANNSELQPFELAEEILADW